MSPIPRATATAQRRQAILDAALACFKGVNMDSWDLLPPVVLTLGIYDMHERNTPGVGAVLARYGLTSLPEAHCYLTYAGMRIDVTRSGADPSEPIGQFLHEEVILPAQIGAYKLTLHRQFLQHWVSNNVATLRGLGVEDVWRIREECIAALEQCLPEGRNCYDPGLCP